MARASRKLITPGHKIRVLIVDDSVVIRQLVTHALSADPDLEVVGVAANGSIALARIAQLNPDVITLDIEMPEMNGLETLKRLRNDAPDVRTIMFSTLTERGGAMTLEALSLGADDYVTKASNEGSLDRSMARLREELIVKIKQFFVFAGREPSGPASGSKPVSKLEGISSVNVAERITVTSSASKRPHDPSIVAIGVSTGGPAALAAIMPKFKKDFPLPILIVQHMPPLFTKLLAERLHASCALEVEEAVDGAVVLPGKVWIAPGDFHMRVASHGAEVRIRLNQEAPENSCRPAVDVLFNSVAEVYGDHALAAVLTGMGRDGQRGAMALKAKGATVLAQDEASSVVWGMPSAVVEAGAADAVLALEDLQLEIVARAGGPGRAGFRHSAVVAPARSEGTGLCPR